MTKILLVVDDMLPIQQFLQLHLERAGYTVLTCSNGQEALEMLRLERVDAVVTDLLMPVMDGVALSKAIKATYRTPIILMDYPDNRRPKEESIAALKEAWSDIFDDVLPKPFTPETLTAEVNAFFAASSSAE